MSFLQSKTWQKFQESIGRKTWIIEHGSLKSLAIELDLPLNQRYLYVPRGPIINFSNEGGLRNDIEYFYRKLVEIGLERNSVFIKIEPSSDTISQLIFQPNLIKSNRSVQPLKTVVVDLLDSEEDALKNMHHKTRYNINVARKNGIEIRDSQDLNTFLNLLRKSSEFNRFHTHTEDYYKSLFSFLNQSSDFSVFIKIAYWENKPVAGAMFMVHDWTAYYLHGGMDREYRNLMAPYLLHWETMKECRAKGILKYDFWGINENLYPGVTRFKLGWGGSVIEYPGSFDLPLKKVKYYLLSLIRKMRR